MKILRTTLGAMALVAAIGCELLSAQAPTPSDRTLEVEDFFRMPTVGAPVVSPSGDHIAFTVAHTSLEEEKRETHIWMVERTGGEMRAMTAQGSSAGAPGWSPDGRLLTFTAARGEGAKTQVWALDVRGGEARPLTSVPQGVSGYAWSPDGTRLALLVRDPEPEGEWTSSARRPWVIDRLQFKRDGSGYLDRRRTHLYVYSLADESLVQLTEGDFDHSSPRWSPDGTRIAFVSNRTAEPDSNANSDIWIVDATATDPPEPTRVTANAGSDGSPAWSPDGRSIAYTTVVEPEKIWYATRHLAIVDASGDSPRLLTRDLDRNVSAPRFTVDGQHVWFELEDSGERHLARVDLGTGEITRPLAGHRSTRGFDMDTQDRVVARVASPTQPAEIFALEESGPRGLTRVHAEWMGGVRLGEVRNVHFRNPDGMEIEGFLTLPPDYQPGQRYPTLLRIHGGPVSQFDASFNFEAQLFAANGYAVLQTNPRGSSGYGQAFSHALWANWGVPDFADVMAGVDWLVDQGIADPERLGVGGWSYGGILTNYVITKSDRFKAAISGASEVLYAANYGHDHYQRQWEAELGLPWDEQAREDWERISPFNDVEHVVTPTLIMGGEHDWNVPIQNSEQLYQALRRLGVETQLVVYPGQGHGIRAPAYQKDRWERYLAWYDRFLRPGQPVS